MSKIFIGVENSYTNAPLIWAQSSGIFKRNGLNIEVRSFEFTPGRLDLFNALDQRKLDLIIAPFENSIEKIASQYSIAMIKQFSCVIPSSACYARDRAIKNVDGNTRFVGFQESEFEFEAFAARLGLQADSANKLSYVRSQEELISLMKADNQLLLFCSGFSNQAVSTTHLTAVKTEEIKRPCSVVLAHVKNDDSFHATSGISHNDFVEHLIQFDEAIEESVHEIRESDRAIGAVAAEIGCAPDELQSSLIRVNWTTGFEPELDATKAAMHYLTAGNLCPNCDFLDPSEFWNRPTKGPFFGT